MDLDALVGQTEAKMQAVSAIVHIYTDSIREYQATFDQTLSVIADTTDRAKQSINENQSLINQMKDAIGSLGAAGNTKIDELDQKLGEFSEKTESIEQEITATIISYAESLQANTQLALDSSESLISSSTEYADLIQAFGGNFNDTTSLFDQLKDVVLETIGSTVETATSGLDGSIANLSSLKDLCSTNATELLQKFQSMAEASESLSQDLLDGTTAINGEKLALVESLIGSDVAGKIVDGSISLKDAADALRTLGLNDIEEYATKISDVLEYTDKIQDIYSDIKPLIDLVS